MMIMLVFNSASTPTFKHILDVTGIPRAEIANHLLTLAHPKVGVLLKNPNNDKLEDNHLFKISPKYRPQLKRVQIPVMRLHTKTTSDADSREAKAIQLQRRHQIDAAVVRIMKTRKTLRHNLLVAEVAQQLNARFQPSPNDIKKRIEALIEQEYLERDKNERATYNYLA